MIISKYVKEIAKTLKKHIDELEKESVRN